MSRLDAPISGRSNRQIFLLWLLIWASVSTRWIFEFVEEEVSAVPVLVGILLVFGILMAYESLRHNPGGPATNVILAVQTGLALAAMSLYFELDFFALLFLPLAGQAVLVLPRAQAQGWIGILVVATIIGQIDQFGWPAALPFMLLYVTGVLFVALFSLNTLRAEAARQASENLLTELRSANAKLQAYAGQAEALAVAEERNRLARDLHDSVAQSLYGLNLRSEAALRHLEAGRYDRIASFLNDFRDGALQSLRETRLLIHELRPQILADQGLAAALAQRLDHVERRSGLAVDFQAGPLPDLADDVEIALYRIAQEALNNVLKHAQARSIRVRLEPVGELVRLVVSDDGIGMGSGPGEGLGLENMQERAKKVGGTLAIRPVEPRGLEVEVLVPGGAA